MYEHSLRPPLIVLGPDVPKAKKQKAPVYLQDIMATALEYAGGEVPSWVEFHSLKPFIDGKRSATYYPAVYGAYMDLQRMIRENDYKLIVYPEAGVLKLFNLETDPEEVRNLAAEPGQLERVRDLFAKLEDLQQEMGDTLRLRDYSFEMLP
jgi:arylsulfatase A-like enzyme